MIPYRFLLLSTIVLNDDYVAIVFWGCSGNFTLTIAVIIECFYHLTRIKDNHISNFENKEWINS